MNNANLEIGLKTKFVIYGAGGIGQEIYYNLKKQGLDIVAYIDRNANAIMKVNSIPVISLEEFNMNRTECVVIISILNIFEHESIANELYKNGFKFIVCKKKLNDYKNEKENSKLYDKIRNGDAILKERVNQYDYLTIQYNIPNPIYEYKNDIIAYVPIEVLRGACIKEHYETYSKSELIDKVYDKSVNDYLVVKELYNSFEKGTTKENWLKYMKIYKQYRSHMLESFQYSTKQLNICFEKHLNERYDVFQNLEYLFQYNYEYFKENPALIKWNGSMFNIIDGNNRISFLMSKNLRVFPCKMSKTDYEEWLNRSTYTSVCKMMESIQDNQILYPLSHPGFKNILRDNNMYLSFIQAILHYFRAYGYSQSRLRILDMHGNTGYFAQQMCRSNHRVTMYVKQEMVALSRNINELEHCSRINLISEANHILEKEYDCILLDLVNYSVEDELINDIITNIRARMVFVEYDSFTISKNTLINIMPNYKMKILSTYPCKDKLVMLMVMKRSK